MELLSSSELTLEEGFCAFAYGEGDGDFDPNHRMDFAKFHAVAIDHLSNRLSESAIAELFHSGLDLNGDGFVDGHEWLHALRLSQQFTSRQAPHASILPSSALLQQQPLSFEASWNLDSTLARPGVNHVLASNHHLPLTQSDAPDASAQVERHRLTPMWLDETWNCRELTRRRHEPRFTSS